MKHRTTQNFFFILTSVFAAKYEYPMSYSESKSESEEFDDIKEALAGKRNQVDLRGTLRKSFAVQMALTSPNVNLVCSPISALFPLGKLVLGAEKSGQNELLDAIGVKRSEVGNMFKSLADNLKYLEGVTITVVSKIYVSKDERLNSKFVEDTQSIFQSSIEKVDFRSPVDTANSINRWIKKHTNGMIPEIISPGDISIHSSVILVNAVYFNGEWERPFRTVKDEPFHSQKKRGQVRMMSRIGTYRYVKSELLHSKIIEIPYKNDKASLVILLPYKKGLLNLLNQLKANPELLNEAMARMKMKPVSLKIPKFKISASMDLRVLYEKIKLNRIFRDNSDLTKIVEGKTVTVSKAIHKAVIEVSEYGTKASAASASPSLFLEIKQ